jgi:hypothetical protein
MGDHSTGILAYGYDLGSSEEWKMYPNPETLGWYHDDYFDDAMKQLLKVVVGFDEVWVSGAGAAYFDRKRAAEAKLGVQIVVYGTGDYRGYILATTVHSVGDFGAEPIDLIMIDHSASTKLYDALQALGITPTQDTHGWILASHYG